MIAEEALEAAPVVSRHALPQNGPQEWDCGCVTAVYVTDRDGLRGEEPFEMRLVHRCGKVRCRLRWQVYPSVGTRFRSVRNKTDCVWTVRRVDRGYPASAYLIPSNWRPSGGVMQGGAKAIYVPLDRLMNTRFWEAL